jgi:nucleoid DNA-binding protein
MIEKSETKFNRKLLAKEIVKLSQMKEQDKTYYTVIDKIIYSFIEAFPFVLKREGKIKIGNFGTFHLKKKSERLGTNFHTGERITISARNYITFKPSILLKKELIKYYNDNYLFLSYIKANILNEKFGDYYGKDFLSNMFTCIKYIILKSHRFELRKFGVFTIKQKSSCVRRNPRIGGKINVPPKWVLHFKASKILFKEVNDK